MNEINGQNLEIYKYKSELLSEIRKNKYLVVIGDTGSGKTTQIPQYLLDEKFSDDGGFFYKRILVTQPRRVAAISAARRVCDERDVELGGSEVGYSIRFEKMCKPHTRLTYTTDGLFLRELMRKPNAEGIDVVILDEAHERGLQTDVLIGLLRKLSQYDRSDLKIIIMSATLEHKKFSQFFDNSPVFVIPGRQYPVEIRWLNEARLEETESTYVSLSAECVYHIHLNEGPGSILVFLTGRIEIQKAIYQLTQLIKRKSETEKMETHKLLILPIFSSMEMSQQRRIFEPAPPGYRKAIVSTNIAQTSITIPDVVYVVDSGFVKQKIYDPSTGMNALVLMPISQTASIQRAGRAGRTSPGKVYRLYSQEDFNKMEQTSKPQIQNSSLTGTILLLKQIGIKDIINFPLIDPPDKKYVITAIKQLYLLGALDSTGRLTKHGELMNMFPLSPLLSKTIVSSALEFGYLSSVIDIISLLSSESLFVFSGAHDMKNVEIAYAKFRHESGDHMSLLNIFNSWKKHGYSKEWCKFNYLNYRALIISIKTSQQLTEICYSAFGECSNSGKNKSHTMSESVLMSLCAGFYFNTARRLRGSNVYYHYITSLKINTDSNAVETPYMPFPDAQNHSLKKPSFFSNISSYKNTGLFALFLHPESVLHDGDIHNVHMPHDPDLEWLIYNELYYSKKPMMRNVSKIKYKWIKKYITLPLQPIDYVLLCHGKSDQSSNTHPELPNSCVERNFLKIDTIPQINPTISRHEMHDTESGLTPDLPDSMDTLINAARSRYEKRKKKLKSS